MSNTIFTGKRKLVAFFAAAFALNYVISAFISEEKSWCQKNGMRYYFCYLFDGRDPLSHVILGILSVVSAILFYVESFKNLTENKYWKATGNFVIATISFGIAAITVVL